MIGILSAMTEENESLTREMGKSEVSEAGKRTYHAGLLWNVPTVVVFSRWGKVAAATSATFLISKFNVSEIIFTGVAGAADPKLKIGDVVVGNQLYQHDMDASPLFPRHKIPLLGVTEIQTDQSRRRATLNAAHKFLKQDLSTAVEPEVLHDFGIARPQVIEGDIASGDKFFADKVEINSLRSRLPSISCVEMEGAAVAQVCFEYGVPYSIIRTISDSADEAAHIDFPKFVDLVAKVYSHGILKNLLQDRMSI
jgi:adenosylhomocysteine nucleosidase